MRRVSRIRAAILFLPILAVLAAPTALATDFGKERHPLLQPVKRFVIKVMEKLGIPPG